MRRILSILLAIGLGLGPALAAVPANALAAGLLSARSGWTGKVDESSLPACCRRNGKHHCVMTALENGETSISAPDCCPCLPHALVSTAPVSAALLAVTTDSLAYPTERVAARYSTDGTRSSDHRSWPKRGPPALQTI
jgi:hypothetical protein